MVSSDRVLDVDLIAFESGSEQSRLAVVDGVRRSLTTGFVTTSHDLEAGLLDEAYGMLGLFFAASTADKSEFSRPETHGQRGYTGLLVETAASSDHSDLKEMLNWGHSLPSAHPLASAYPNSYAAPVFPEEIVPGIGDVLLTLHDRLLDVQRRFLRVIALGLGCAESFFDEMVADGPTLSRAIRYPPMAEAPGPAHVWADEHDDINLITALPRATDRGLQVLVDGDWIDVVPPEGHMIINTGMMLERLSNGVIPAGRHRVVASEGQVGERLSFVQFCHPTPWTVLAPLASCVSESNPTRYSAISAADALQKVLWEINLIGT